MNEQQDLVTTAKGLRSRFSRLISAADATSDAVMVYGGTGNLSPTEIRALEPILAEWLEGHADDPVEEPERLTPPPLRGAAGQ